MAKFFIYHLIWYLIEVSGQVEPFWNISWPSICLIVPIECRRLIEVAHTQHLEMPTQFGRVTNFHLSQPPVCVTWKLNNRLTH